ncbi:TPA: hypothetical protein G8O67_004782 [Salmonella enterica]|uniref:Uncharacterized protein n=1 Tax=Salmonella enterica TaxID=28901 RepID=A0A756IGG0_SALER|nr:hypothetical protein [Salmonella enterica]
MIKTPKWLHYSNVEMFAVGAVSGASSPYLCEWLHIGKCGVIEMVLICVTVGVTWLLVKRLAVIALARINARKRGDNENT